MALLHDNTTQTVITQYISLEETIEDTQIENASLDGTYYLQSVGVPVVYYEIVAYVTRAGKAALQNAKSNGNLLTATIDRGTYSGRITAKGLKCGNRLPRDYFKAEITLAKEVTV